MKHLVLGDRSNLWSTALCEIGTGIEFSEMFIPIQKNKSSESNLEILKIYNFKIIKGFFVNVSWFNFILKIMINRRMFMCWV